ncbi:MAG: hypothetical protein DKT66_23195 [Candidatus Melainabacteria bacterium]|nr:MAG: hypothetical protein DKT66_23195 [Candidatus Melainabacteria bacterium]
MKRTYGLELTNNSKVSWAFSLPRSKTCIDATEICKKLCYGRGIRYQSQAQKDKRERNYRTVELLLKNGGPELLAQNLVHLIDSARPRDWLTSKLMKTKPDVPWTLRIHDVGDFYSTDYSRAWQIAVCERPECDFWFYTRSFQTPAVYKSLGELASLPNCQGWLSVDADNLSQGLLALCNQPAARWKLAILQSKDLQLEHLQDAIPEIGKANIINFPYHHGGRNIAAFNQQVVTSCPAIVGDLKLTNDPHTSRPCQLCSYCLPG